MLSEKDFFWTYDKSAAKDSVSQTTRKKEYRSASFVNYSSLTQHPGTQQYTDSNYDYSYDDTYETFGDNNSNNNNRRTNDYEDEEYSVSDEDDYYDYEEEYEEEGEGTNDFAQSHQSYSVRNSTHQMPRRIYKQIPQSKTGKLLYKKFDSFKEKPKLNSYGETVWENLYQRVKFLNIIKQNLYYGVYTMRKRIKHVKEEEPDAQCTFKPQLTAKNFVLYQRHDQVSFLKRNELWNDQRQNDLIKRRQVEIWSTLKECTFQPKKIANKKFALEDLGYPHYMKGYTPLRSKKGSQVIYKENSPTKLTLQQCLRPGHLTDRQHFAQFHQVTSPSPVLKLNPHISYTFTDRSVDTMQYEREKTWLRTELHKFKI